MYPFGHQGTGFRGYYNTNYYAPSWNGNQNQYDDQCYYDEGYYQESYQHENFDPQRYQAMPQVTAQTSNIAAMLSSFLKQQKERDQERKVIYERIEQNRISVERITNQLEQQSIAATERFMNKKVEMEIDSHQEIQVYEAGIYSNIIYEAVGDDLDTSLPSELGVETEQYVESMDESCEDLADMYPCAITKNPQENMNVTVEDGCEVWKPSFPTVEYARNTLVGAEYEDVYLSAPPPDKFWQFFPYISELPNERSHDPTILLEAYILKRARPYFHFILHGRRFKWDLKVD